MNSISWSTRVALSITISSLFLSGMGSAAPEVLSRETPVASDRIVSANTSFGLRLFRELAAQDDDNNILISPTGLGMALAMTYNGAAGETAREMAAVLGVEGLGLDAVNGAYLSLMDELPASGQDVRLDIANSLWADRDLAFKDVFLENNRTFFGAMIENLDLGDPAAHDTINAWIQAETRGMLGPVIDKIDRDVVLYLINAMYFKGRWAIPFDGSHTSPREFTLTDGSTRTVPTMTTGPGEGHYYLGDGFKAARLDYGDGSASMYLFLPDKESSLDEFYEKLDADNWNRWLAGFETGPSLVLLPRFKIEHDIIVNDALKALGMKRAFSKADFSRMTSASVFISMVKHSTMLEVDEEGTEGASAAIVELKKGGALHLAFLRPFSFAVVDNATGAILFIGSVVKP